jgi:hypothetical protein
MTKRLAWSHAAVIITAILGIATVEGLALWKGIDGTALAAAVAAMAGLAGWRAGRGGGGR